MRCATRFFAALAAVAAVGYASTASAAQYIVDSNLSSITITGSALGNLIVLGPQSLGSNTATFGGTIDATSNGTDITFNSAAIDANLLANPQSPAVGGGAGSAPADVGLSISGLVSGSAAIRDFILGLSSGAIPLAGGTTFGLPPITLDITSGSLDYNVTGLLTAQGNASIVGESANPTAGVGTLIGDTLTIPVSVTITFPLTTGVNADVVLLGQIVATEVIPEPGTIAMLGMGIIGLVAVGRRRFRKA
jgi:hypothetical protein